MKRFVISKLNLPHQFTLHNYFSLSYTKAIHAQSVILIIRFNLEANCNWFRLFAVSFTTINISVREFTALMATCYQLHGVCFTEINSREKKIGVKWKADLWTMQKENHGNNEWNNSID